MYNTQHIMTRAWEIVCTVNVKGDDATPSARKAAETRRERHPHLLPVWDADKRAIRSVNLSTVTRITVDGHTHRFAA